MSEDKSGPDKEKSESSVHPDGVQGLKKRWPQLGLFERFEYLVMLFLSLILALIILVALARLVENVYELVTTQFSGNTEFKAFQTTFGMLLTLLIAFEFYNSISAVIEGRGLLIQVRIVILIAIVALARKFLVLDTKEVDAATLAAYAGITLSLGAVYWLLCRQKCSHPEQA